MGVNKADIKIDFEKNMSRIENNDAGFATTRSDETGYYMIELPPGYYNITIFSDDFDIGGINYSYVNSGETHDFYADDSKILSGDTFDIKLEMKEEVPELTT